MQNPFSWDYLTAPLSETPTFGPFSIAYLVLFGFIFLASAFLYYDAPRRFADHKLHRDLVRSATQWLMWVTAIGLVFFGIRALRFPFLTFERRIWLYLMSLVLLALIGYFVYYWRQVYPARLAAFEKNRERRMHMPRTARRERSRGMQRRRAAR